MIYQNETYLRTKDGLLVFQQNIILVSLLHKKLLLAKLPSAKSPYLIREKQCNSL